MTSQNDYCESEKACVEITSKFSWLINEPCRSLQDKKLALLEHGTELFDMSMINPDMDPPRMLLDRLAEASLKVGASRYAVSRGVRRLRSAFASKYDQLFDTQFNPDSEICVSMGAKDGLLHALMCLSNKNDGLLYGSPTYPTYSAARKLLNLKGHSFPIVNDEAEMLASIEKNLRDNKIRFLILNFPNNPTGVSVTKDFYHRLYCLAVKYDLIVLNDFVYGEMFFGGPAAASLFSEPKFKERAVEIYSLSKAYSVPGWRVGAVVGNSTIIGALSKLKSHIDYGIFLPIQSAAQAALLAPGDLVYATKAEYETRATVLTRGLSSLGWKVTMPSAGASIWAEIPDHFEVENTYLLAEQLLDHCAVAVQPGKVFGEEWGRYLRFALVLREEKLRIALNRIASFQENLQEISTRLLKDLAANIA